MSRRRGLTPEEEALWRKAMRDVAPFRAKKPFAEKLVSPLQSGTMPASAAPSGLLPLRRHTVDNGRRIQHPFAAGDPRLDRMAGRGRIPVDAVLDLHGHTQHTAHSALLRFVADAHAHGARCVLVITGKGAAPMSAYSLRGGGAPHPGAGSGVLRARFADWLAEEPLRKLVSRASPAHQRHGGAGAFYVFLKR